MDDVLYREVRDKLSEFNFKEEQGWLRKGVCPNCRKKELYTNAENPWVLRCGRLNNCGYEASIKELYPDLFDKWSNRYQPTESNNFNRNAAADAYLSMGRGFDLSLVKGWYSQESYFDHRKQQGSATVRFPACGSWWERLIDEPGRFGSRKAGFATGSKYKGLWWQAPNANLTEQSELWITEGIFNAIALMHHGIMAVSAMSCNNYPDKALSDLAKACGDKRPTLVWALDNDPAGTSYMKRWVERSRSEGWLATARLIPKQGQFNRDWNDLHILDKASAETDYKHFSDKAMDEYRYQGQLLIAKSATDKAFLMYQKTGLNKFDFDYGNRWYWFELDVEKYHKAMDRLEESNQEGLTLDELQELAVTESGGLRTIAQCLPTPLYYQRNARTDESWYYYRISFPHDQEPVKDTFTASQLASVTEFKKRLLHIAQGSVYTGSGQMLERSIEKKLYNIKVVETIDFIGYSSDHKAYVFNNVAVKDGRISAVNDEDYFDCGNLAIKSLLNLYGFHINRDPADYKSRWTSLLHTAYGVKGLVALTFFFGSLFAEQVRAEQASFPFLELVGDAATGKTTLIEFLWRLLGRVQHEGFDPEKSSPVARARNLAQVANLPVVLIEGDRAVAADQKASHAKRFEWDELKTAYNGRSIRSRGLATPGNETYDPPFRGTIVISQNEVVKASEAIMTRIVHLYFDGEGYNEITRKAATELSKTEVEEVSGFLLSALTKEEKILEIIFTKVPEYTDKLLANPKIRLGRIAHNHAQLMAFADALRLVVKMDDSRHERLLEFIEQMAVERQQVINDDHPAVQEFWELYEYLNGDDEYEPKLNHSTDPAYIAINLNEYVELAVMAKQQVPSLRDLKSVLKTSRKYRYEGQRCVHSAIKARIFNQSKSTSTRCWIFSKK